MLCQLLQLTNTSIQQVLIDMVAFVWLSMVQVALAIGMEQSLHA